ncbi:MAG: hypothetical protein N4A33_12140 [Bacteriovoracaceae bacterium]|jgi:hypothetical protein|nr:hypothetical protein [Bacteriovoracaceae bacterium]
MIKKLITYLVIVGSFSSFSSDVVKKVTSCYKNSADPAFCTAIKLAREIELLKSKIKLSTKKKVLASKIDKENIVYQEFDTE